MEEKFAAAAFLIFVAVTTAAAASEARQPYTVDVEFSTPGTPGLSLEVADTERERKRGLMYRESLESDGMLFVFPEEKRRAFWMKNTFVPLDIIYLDAEKTVVDVDRADPQPGVPDSQLERYWSDSPAMYVIEVRQGFAKEHGIEKGTKVSFELQG